MSYIAESRYDTLRSIIAEFKNLSPETTNVLLFDGERQTIAATKDTSQDQKQNFLTTFAALNDQTKAIGGVEKLTIQATKSRLNITAMAPFFLATVTSRKANPKVIKSLTQVVFPTMVYLVNQNVDLSSRKEVQDLLNPEEAKESAPLLQEAREIETIPEPELPSETVMPETVSNENTNFPSETESYDFLTPEKIEDSASLSQEAREIETIPEPELPFEIIMPETPGNHFVVEKISDFFVSSDTVRIDGEVIARWFGLSGGKKIKLVSIETSWGRKALCKFKPMDELFKRKFGTAAVTVRRKETKSNTQGIIQIPEKIIQSLQTDKGKLVMVKPVIDQTEE